MKEARYGAAAVQMGQGWWVAGTIDIDNISFLKTKALFDKLI